MKQVVYVACSESKEIYVWNLDKTGKLRLLQKLELPGKIQPMKISPDGKYLYAGIRPNFSIITYLILNQGKLSLKRITPIDSSPTHIEIDRFSRWLFIASYHQDNLVVLPIDQWGIPKPEVQVIKSLKNPHSSWISCDNSHLFIPCLGEDHIRVYSIGNNGNLREVVTDCIYTKTGAGPRHLVFRCDQNVFYCLNELDATIVIYSAFRPYQEIQSYRILPLEEKDAPWAADVHVTPDGCHLYASERSTSIIRHFQVIPEALRLSAMECYKTESQPRGFNIDKTGQFLIVAGQKSNHISVYRIDGCTGKLKVLDRYPVGKGPMWIKTRLEKD